MPVRGRVLRTLGFFCGLLVMTSAPAGPAAACGVESDCPIGDRDYRIQLPPNAGGEPVGALIFAHGYRGSSQGTMRNKALRALTDELGIAFIAVNAAGDDWDIPGVPNNMQATGETELAYFDALIDDVVETHNIDRTRIVMSGFSAGGMITWHLACHRGETFAGYIPIAGTHWAPVPETCPASVQSLVHIHGLSDRIVPLEGRPIQKTHQGSVPRTLARHREAGQFGAPVSESGAGLDCETATNSQDKIMAFCTHPGGHAIRSDFLRFAWAMLTREGGF